MGNVCVWFVYIEIVLLLIRKCYGWELWLDGVSIV